MLSSDLLAKLATYDTPTGETYFALSLTPPTRPAAAEAHDVVVLFDTSASQTGMYREGALAALKSMLSGLGEGDRVKLVAVDLNAVDMTQRFVSPNSPEMARQT